MNKLLLGLLVASMGGAALWWSADATTRQRPSGRESGPAPEASLASDEDASADDPAPAVVRGIGYVEPVSEIRRLVFKVDGVIELVHVEVGQQVQTGDTLAVLRNQDEQAAVGEAERRLALAIAERDQLLAGAHAERIAAARHQVALLEERYRFAKRQQARIAALTARGVSTDAQRDETETEMLQAERSLQQAQAELAHLEHQVRPVDSEVAQSNVRLAEAHLKTAKQRLANTVMVSPLDGTVLEIVKREGEGARVLDPDPVMIFADESQLRVRAEIDERYVYQLAAGQTAEVYGRALGDVRYRGTVSLVKRLMGDKTVFSHAASERKDLDVLQVLIDLPAEFRAPLGLQVDVDVMVPADGGQVAPVN